MIIGCPVGHVNYHGNRMHFFLVDTRPIKNKQGHAFRHPPLIWKQTRSCSLCSLSGRFQRMTPLAIVTLNNFHHYRAAHRPWKFLLNDMHCLESELYQWKRIHGNSLPFAV